MEGLLDPPLKDGKFPKLWDPQLWHSPTELSTQHPPEPNSASPPLDVKGKDSPLKPADQTVCCVWSNKLPKPIWASCLLPEQSMEVCQAAGAT